jgi:hypothetical protein
MSRCKEGIGLLSLDLCKADAKAIAGANAAVVGKAIASFIQLDRRIVRKSTECPCS